MHSRRLVILILSLLALMGSLAAQTPQITNGTPAGAFPGEQFCFDTTFTNSGNPGYGPYIRLILPAEIQFSSATFLGSGVTVTPVGTFPAAPVNQLLDPLSNSYVTGPEGGTLTLLVLPVGSVVTGGPDLITHICARIDSAVDVGVSLDVTVQPVYRYGDTATGVNGPITGTAVTRTVSTSLMTVNKTVAVAEGERAPGASFQFTYTVSVDVADAKSVHNVVIDDLLPDGVQYVGPVSITGGVNGVVSLEPSTSVPGGHLVVSLDRIDGTISGQDVSLTFPVYITDVLDENICDSFVETNTVTVDGEYPLGTPLPQAGATANVTAKHLAVQKGVSPGTTVPGSTVTFTINFQLSEYAFPTNLSLTDVLADGFTFGTTQSVTVGGVPAAVTPSVSVDAAGQTTLNWDLGPVVGPLLPGTTGSIVYTATIDQTYTASGTSVLANDTLGSTVTGHYDMIMGAIGCSDGSGATVRIRPVSIRKTILNPQVEYYPGDRVTFRLEMDVPSGDTDQIVFEDFFPLPVFDVSTINTTYGVDIVPAATDTLGLTPTGITAAAGTNSLRITWPSISTTSTQTLAVDVSVTLQADPYADDLYLTNLLQVYTANTPGQQAVGLTPIQLRVRAPELVLTKGISDSSNGHSAVTITADPSNLPVNGDISAADAFDTLTYVITVENIGGSAAYDVVVTDPAVAGLGSGNILSVIDGNGLPVTYRDVGDVPAPAVPTLPLPHDLSGGIRLDNPLAINDGSPGAPYGTDTVIITIQYTLTGTVQPSSTLVNTASATWASQDGATTFPAATDSASVTTAEPSVAKSVTAIDPGYAGDLTHASVGEVITYQVVVTLPEGTTPNLTVSDVLDTGLALTDVVSITPSSGDLATSVAGGFAGVLANAVITNSGAADYQRDRQLTFDFGTITNSNSTDFTAETITVVYRARVLNLSSNVNGIGRNNAVTLGWSGGSDTAAAANVTIVEPDLQVVTSLSASGGDAGDVLTVTLAVSHTAASTADAFDLTLTDVIPAGMTFGGGLISAGTAPTILGESGGMVTATWDSLPQGSTSTISFQVTVDGTVTPTEAIQNSARLEWESLSDGIQADLPGCPTNPYGVERTGNTGDPGQLNDYAATDAVTLTIADATVSKSVSAMTPAPDAPAITAGDLVTYSLRVTLPEGTTPGLTLSDVLPAGLSFQSATPDTTGFNGSVSLVSATGDGAVATGETVAITFGASTTVTADNNPVNNSFSIQLTARVEGSQGANSATTGLQAKTNTVTLDYTGNTGTIRDTATLYFVEPVLTVTKTMSPDTGLDAGDTVTVTLVVRNTGTATAYDVVLSDILGTDLFDTVTGPLEGTTPAGFTYNWDGTTVTYTSGATSLAAGSQVTFTFTATVQDLVVSGSTYSNTASVTGDSEPGAVTGQRSTTGNGSDTVSTGIATVGKSLLHSSEAWTSDVAPVWGAIGEVMTYRVVFDLPEGVTRETGTSAIITDTLPAGLQYVTGTAVVRAVTDTAITGSTFGSIPTTDTAVTPTVNGQVLEFDLGNLTNGDSDANAEQLILTYDVLVANTSDNNRGGSKTNTVALNYANKDGNPQSVTDTASLLIAEPVPSLSKSAAPSSVEGGSTVTFTVVLTNTNVAQTTRAWDPVISDPLPARYRNPAVVSATLSRGSVDVSASATFAGLTLTADLSALASTERYLGPNERLTVVYSADVDPSINFEEQVTNTATGTFTSLPGTNGTADVTPGAAGSATGERTGSGSGVNDLATTASATVTAGRPTITKTVADSTLQILQTSVTTLTVDVPVGTTDNFVITDNLPAGLRFTGSPITITPPASNFSSSLTPATPAAGADPLVFDFGSVTNSAASPQTLTVRYEVEVANVIGNQNTTTLTNAASMSYSGATLPLPADSATTTVIEPNLAITRTVTAGAAGSDAGDTVSYQVTVRNTSTTATAYRVNLRDVLPAHQLGAPDGTGSAAVYFGAIALTNPGNAVTLNSGGVLTAADATFATTNLANDTLTWPLFDLPPNTTLTITYNVVLSNDVVAGESMSSNTRADYNSRSDGTGRDNSGSGDDDNNAVLNNYGESASALINVASTVAIQKGLNAIHTDSNFAVGDQVTYDLRVDLVEGVVNNVVVTDMLPTGLTYVGPMRIVAGPQISYDGSGTAVESPTGTITVSMGNVSNTADGNDANDYFIIELDARVDDIAGNTAGVTRTNSVSLSTGAGNAGPATHTLTIVEPHLEITQTPSDPNPSLGDTVTFTVDVHHQGSTSTAYDVVLTDVIPAGLTYVTGSHSGDGTVDETDSTHPIFNLGTITLADAHKTFTLQCTVDRDATVGQALTNTLDLSYDSQSGTPTLQRVYTGSSDADVTPSTPTFIDALKTVALVVDGGTTGVVDPGDTLEYTIVLTNQGQDVTGAVFSDTIPAGTSYVGGSLSTDTGVADDSGQPDLVVTLGDMAASSVATVTFRVRVNAGTPAGTTISNQGSVDSDQTVPEPTDADGIDANGDQPTEIEVGGAPALSNALYVTKVVEWVLDADGSGDITPGDTLRYYFIFENQGDQALTNVSLTDTLPAGLTYVAASADISSGGTINVAGAAVTAQLPALAVDTVDYAVLDVTVDAPLVNFNGDATHEIFTNQGSATSDQTRTIPTDSNGDPADGYQPTVVTAVTGLAGTPQLDVEKRWYLAVDIDGDGLVDPGDTVEYWISVANVGSAEAYNVRLSDPTPSGTSVVTGSVRTSLGVVLTESPTQVNMGTLAPGGQEVVDFRVIVSSGTPDGTILVNQATVSGDNFAAEPSDDNGSDADGKNPTLTPVDAGGGSGSGTPSGLLKVVQATSEADTGAGEAYIGEVLTYRITASLPAGRLSEVTLRDVLPAGLTYIPGTARLARVFNTGLTASMNPGGINSAAAGNFVTLTDGLELAVSGQTLSLFLGDIINSDNDAGAESYLLEVRTVVANEAGNQAGTALTNSADLEWLNGLGQPQTLTPVTTTMTVREAGPVVTKVAAPALLLPRGGDVTFTLVVTNPAAAQTGTAYDMHILDTLPVEFTSLTVDSITPSGGVTGVTDLSAGTTVELEVATFPADGRLEVVYTATAPATLAAGTLGSAAQVTWTSLPGTHGTGNATPGAPGAADGERTGSGSGANDYLLSARGDVTVGDVSVSKTILNPQGRYAIGDQAEYRVTITFPGDFSLDDCVVTDVLDEGLTYVNGSLAIGYDTGIGSSTAPTEFVRAADTPVAGQETLTLDLGTVTNTSAAAAVVTLTYRAVVDNILSNQDNQTLANNLTLTVSDPAGSGNVDYTAAQSVTVGEPHLALTNTITSSTAGLDAGDAVDFRVVVDNDGSTPAYDLVLNDVLPAGLANVTGLSVDSVSGGAPTPVLVNNGTDWQTNPFDLPVGASVTITFSAQLDDTVIPGQQIQASVTAVFSSRSGADAAERDGSGAGAQQDDNSILNNYRDLAVTGTITVADPVSLDKTFYPDPANDTYAIGETVTWRLRVDILEGTVDHLVVTDTLPAGVRFVSATVGVGNVGMTTGYGGAPAQVGQVLAFDLGTVINPANASDTDDSLSIDIRAVVEDVPGNVNGTRLGNNAELTFAGPSGDVTRTFDADLGTAGIQPLELQVVEPELTLTKTMTPASVPLGKTVTVTLLVDHTGASTADAYDLSVVDTLPAGLNYVAGSASLPPAAVSGQTIRFDLAALTLMDDHVTITFRARLAETLRVDVPVTNSATLTWTSRPGDNPDERTGTDTDTATVTPNVASFVDAVKTVSIAVDGGSSGIVDPGDTLEYRVVLANQGADVTGLVFTDPVPADTAYVAGSLTATVGTVDDTDPTLLRVDVGDLAADGTVTITFRVVVDDGLPAGTLIRNQGRVDSDQTVSEPTDADGIDANGDQPTDIRVGGQNSSLLIPLHVQKTVEWIADADASGTISPGDTLRYGFVFRALGSEAAQSVQLEDILPTGLTPVANSETVSTGLVDLTGQVLRIGIPEVRLDTPVTASVDVTVDGPLYNSDGNPAMETFTNQGLVGWANMMPYGTNQGLTDANSDPADGYQPTVVTAVDGVAGSPAPDVEKRARLVVDIAGDGLINPGDTVEYVVSIRNTGSATILNANLTDSLPADMTLVAGSVSTSSGVVVSETPLVVNLGNLTPGRVETVRVQATVNAGTADGTVIPNQAHLNGDNIAATPSDDNGRDDDGLNPTLITVADGGTGGTPGLVKAVVATSESGSAGTDVLIGEVVTYQLTFSVPAGRSKQIILQDQQPYPGMAYVPGSGRLARVFTTGLTASLDPAGINEASSGQFVTLTDGVDLAVDGPSLGVFLGDVINSDNDTDGARYILQYQALVLNDTGNQAGINLDNVARGVFLDHLDQVQFLALVSSRVTVTEPDVQLQLAAMPPMVFNTGGQVTFTLVVTNPSGVAVAPAYDMVVHSLLPAEWTGLSVDRITATGGVSGVTDQTAGTTLEIDVATFPVDGRLEIVFTGTVTGPLPDGTLPVTAGAGWTSLPGTNGTGSVTPGAPGDNDGERIDGTGPNDYRASVAAEVEVGPVQMVKTVVNPRTRYAIGDPVEYRLTLTFPPRALLANISLDDVLADGLVYEPGSLSVDWPADVSASNAVTDFTVQADTPAAGQETLTLDFGTLTSVSDAIRTVTLDYRARVTNILTNQNNSNLANGATLNLDDPGTGTPEIRAGGQSITLGEPHLRLVDNLVSTATGLQAGDPVVYEIEVTNDGNLPAYDVVLDDPLPDGLQMDGQVAVLAAAGGAVAPTVSTAAGGWSTAPFDLPVGASVSLRVRTRVAVSVLTRQTIQNRVTATYTSRPGADPNERDGSGADANQDDDSILNNYAVAATSAIVTVADPVQLDKQFYPDPADTTWTIGQVVTYRLRLAVLEGTLDDVVLEDTLPDGVRFLDVTVGVGNTGMSTGYGSSPTVTGQTVTLDLGTVSNPGNSSTTDDFLTADIRVVVEDIPANVDGTRLGNNARVSYTGSNGRETREYDADATVPGVQPLDLVIVEPDLTLIKAVNPVAAPPGRTVTFSLTADHLPTSHADAWDLVITDDLPAGLSYMPGSASVEPQVDGNRLTFHIDSLTLLDDQLTITFSARIDEAVVIGRPLTNTAHLSWTTMPGDNPDERLRETDTSVDVIPEPVSFVDALKTVAVVTDQGAPGPDAGDELEYTIVLENRGPAVTHLVFTDPIPQFTGYVDGSLTADRGTVDATGLPVLRMTLDDLAAGQTVTIRFRVTVDDTATLGTLIRNQGQVVSDQTLAEPTDADGIDANGDQPTDLVLGAAGGADVAAVKLVEWTGDVDGSGTITPGDTMRYTVLVGNTGSVDLTDVAVDDTIPAGLSAVEGTATVDRAGATASLTGNRFQVVIPSLAAGAQAEAAFEVRIDGPPLYDGDGNPASETFVNQATVTTAQTPATLTDANGDPTDGLQPTLFTAVQPDTSAQPRLDVEKRATLVGDLDGDGLLDPGETLEYEITLTNTGAATADNVRLNDPVPASTTLVTGSVAVSRGVVISEDPVAVNIGNMAPSDIVMVTFRVTVDPAAPNGTLIANQAVVTRDGGGEILSDDNGDDTDGDNPTVTEVITSRLSIFKSAVPAVVVPGEMITYTLRWENVGDERLGQVTVTDPLPADTGFVSASNGGELLDGVVTWQLGDVEPGVSGELTLIVRVVTPLANGTRIINTDYWINGEGTPPNTGPDVITPVVSAPALAVAKIDDPDPVVAGQTITYTIHYANNGTDRATGVEIRDAVPAGTTFVSASDGGTLVDGVVVWSVGDVPAGGFGSVTLTVRVAPDTPQDTLVINGDYSISCHEVEDPVSGAEETTRVIREARASVTKRDLIDGEVVGPGGTITYEVVIRNTGSEPLSNGVFTDTPDPHTSLVPGSVTATTGEVVVGNGPQDQVVQVAVGDLPLYGEVTIRFRVQVMLPLGSGVHQVANQGRFTCAERAAVPSDDPDTDTVGDPTVTPLVWVELTKVDTADPVACCDVIEYVITCRNRSAVTLHDVQLQEFYDAKVRFESASIAPDNGTDNVWTIGELAPDQTVELRVRVRVVTVNPIVMVVDNEVWLVTDTGAWSASARTTVLSCNP